MLVPLLVFLGCLLVCAVVAAPVLVRLARQLSRTAEEVQRLETSLDERFLPRAESLLGRTTQAIRDLESAGASFRALGRRAEESLSPLGDVTVEVEAALGPFVRSAGELGLTRPRMRALGSGLRAAWKTWRARTGRDDRADRGADTDC